MEVEDGVVTLRIGLGGDRVSVIDELLGVSSDEFNGRIRGTDFALGRAAMSGASPIFSWEHLNDVIENFAQISGQIKICRENQLLPRSLYTEKLSDSSEVVVPAAVVRALNEGYSLILEGLHSFHLPLKQFSALLGRAVGEAVRANAYVSWMPDKAFRTHWDDHDVVIVQTEGQKHWAVFKPTRNYPLANDIAPAPSDFGPDPVWKGVLQKGDVLYVPRGWWHHASSLGGGSIHVTFSFRSQTWLNVLEALVLDAASVEGFRADVVRPENARYKAEQKRLLRELHQFVSSRLKTDYLDHFWRSHDAMLPGERSSYLPYTLRLDAFVKNDPYVRIASIAPAVAFHLEDDQFVIESSGRRWVIDRAAYPILEALAAGIDVRLSELVCTPSSLTRDDAFQLVFELVNDGLLTVFRRADG